MKQHPLSAAFPRMADFEFQDLKDSIENIGVQNPITSHDGMVIDGWHRYSAARELDLPCPVVELAQDIDPREFVMAQNGARRHITQAQIAVATVTVYQWRKEGRPEKLGTQCPVSEKQKSTAELSEIAGVGERTIKQAKTVTAQAAPAVVEAVKRGELGLPKAAAIAKLPREQQEDAIKKPIEKRRPVAQKQDDIDHAAIAQEMRHAVVEIAEECEALKDRLAIAAADATEEERAMYQERMDAYKEKVRALEIELGAVKAIRDSLLAENSELKKQVIYMRSSPRTWGCFYTAAAGAPMR